MTTITKRVGIWAGVLTATAAAIGIISTASGWADGKLLTPDEANRLYVPRSELSSQYATKGDLEELREVLPLEVDKRMITGQIEELDTVIRYGMEHDLDTNLEAMKKSQLEGKLKRLSDELNRLEKERAGKPAG